MTPETVDPRKRSASPVAGVPLLKMLPAEIRPILQLRQQVRSRLML